MKKEKDFYQVSLKILLKKSDGKILGLKALDNGGFAGYYDLPGGRIDTDEFEVSISDVLCREVKEEIGNIDFKIDSKPLALGRHLIPAGMNSTGKDVRVLYLFFEAQYEAGGIKISNEHTDYKWLDLDSIKLENYFTSGILEGVKMYLNK